VVEKSLLALGCRLFLVQEEWHRFADYLRDPLNLLFQYNPAYSRVLAKLLAGFSGL